MSNSTTLLDLLSSTQAAKEAVANALFDAASPATLWGRRASTCSGLTWGYYGGNFQVGTTSNAIADGTLTLTASATNYVYANATTGAVSANATGFPAGSIPLYNINAGSATVTSYTDLRSYQPSAVAAGAGTGTVTSVGLSMPPDFAVANSPVTGSGNLAVTYANQPAGYVHVGPPSGSAAAPTWRQLVGSDLPLFGASGAAHAAGAVPDPGATAGATRYLCENGTWAVPAGGGSGSGMTNPMTTLGDIITGASGGTAQRLGVGSNGQVLTVVSGQPAWLSPTQKLMPSVAQSAAYSGNGPATFTLGAAPQPGNLLVALVTCYTANGYAVAPGWT